MSSIVFFIKHIVTEYAKLINYPHLKVLNRPVKRLETSAYNGYLNNKKTDFIKTYDDAHFHRNYFTNLQLILDAEKQVR